MTPFPDDANRRYPSNHASIGTAILFTLRGCRWIQLECQQSVEAIGQNFLADAIVFAREHPDGVDPVVFVDYSFGRAALLFGALKYMNWLNEAGGASAARRAGHSTGILDWGLVIVGGIGRTGLPGTAPPAEPAPSREGSRRNRANWRMRDQSEYAE